MTIESINQTIKIDYMCWALPNERLWMLVHVPHHRATWSSNDLIRLHWAPCSFLFFFLVKKVFHFKNQTKTRKQQKRQQKTPIVSTTGNSPCTNKYNNKYNFYSKFTKLSTAKEDFHFLWGYQKSRRMVNSGKLAYIRGPSTWKFPFFKDSPLLVN